MCATVAVINFENKLLAMRGEVEYFQIRKDWRFMNHLNSFVSAFFQKLIFGICYALNDSKLQSNLNRDTSVLKILSAKNDRGTNSNRSNLMINGPAHGVESEQACRELFKEIVGNQRNSGIGETRRSSKLTGELFERDDRDEKSNATHRLVSDADHRYGETCP